MTLTPPEHEHSAAITMAAEWLGDNPHNGINRPIVPTLKATFGLTTVEAIAAIREANLRGQRAA
ncbi:hypothetical protein [Mesorhizobium sp.]|uniref:hypothetical protein n=1 Tax=Mesorhizobium sp. TaxID=1871066 RepID=UPI0012093A5C|nr:hypothetical protein [Mesorhizobium sp.]TIL43652.1 MAG: hypothetical protein E5Y86_20810 [Mesorhizobium sp.]TIL53160.1 MAG: hypothetical protein E5Y83_09240 [Mesorhizobium sp.]TIL88935.1 MAG: hypothetical protein E5Y73_22225 [Mesorhizobium sp.]